MAFAWAGGCYETPEEAIAAFAKDVPTADATGINSFTQPPTIDPSGLITWSIANRSFSTNKTLIRTGTTQLQTCTYDSFNPSALADITFILAMIFAFFVGFRSGQAA